MLTDDLDDIRVAITSDSVAHRNYLQTALKRTGISVVMNEPLSRMTLNRLPHMDIDVILLDLTDEYDHAAEYLDQLLDQVEIPVIISDVSALTLNEPAVFQRWHRQLVDKIAAITGRANWDAEERVFVQPKLSRQVSSEPTSIATNVWVLGASLGGPDAVKHFLSALPAKIPVAFIIAQHLGANFVAILAEQLDRYTPFAVSVARHGHVLRHGEILVAPVDRRILINPIGAVELIAYSEAPDYSPSIDMVLTDTARKYGSNAGAIIFSGMCDDGVRGSMQIRQHGGEVWIQEPSSCVISEMPENVAKVVDVDFLGTPEELAIQLASYFP